MPNHPRLVIGVPKEIKSQEGRVGLTPQAVQSLKSRFNCFVLVEEGAGEKAGFNNADFKTAGAQLVPTAKEVYQAAQLIVKVKEILPPEFEFLRPEQAIFAFLHPAANPKMIQVFLDKKILGVSFDMIINRQGRLPILEPMSRVAGKLAIQEALKINPGIKKILVVGCGTAGTAAIQEALSTIPEVKIVALDIKQEKIDKLAAKITDRRLILQLSSFSVLTTSLSWADLVVGAVLVPGKNAPVVIERQMLKIMRPGAIIVDIAIDQGGCAATSRPTTHSHPIYEVDGVIHYCVANMPGAVPKISTPLLVKAHLPYLRQMLERGINPLQWSPTLRRGVCSWQGKLMEF
ncbi:alanine dehydrogenase [Candidatus Parcubacteria bacterium]|nr:MAG: alanine dehydrogenase [Candidatus Parcubacteria bacterium]